MQSKFEVNIAQIHQEHKNSSIENWTKESNDWSMIIQILIYVSIRKNEL